MVNSMKIAFCLFGVVGGDKGKSGTGSPTEVLKIGHEFIDKNIFQHNDVDVFIHTWTTEEKENIESLYKPKKAIYQEQIDFEVPSHVGGSEKRKKNHYSRWYSTKKTLELKKQYEEENNFEYDFVMVCRFDIAFRKKLDFNDYDNYYFYAGNWNRVHDAYGNQIKNRLYYNIMSDPTIDKSGFVQRMGGYPYNEEGLVDFWFFGGSETMDEFGELYDNLDEYTKPWNCPTDHEGWISNHRLSIYHLGRMGFLDKLKFAYYLHDDFPLVRRWHFKCGR